MRIFYYLTNSRQRNAYYVRKKVAEDNFHIEQRSQCPPVDVLPHRCHGSPGRVLTLAVKYLIRLIELFGCNKRQR